jgi:AcrR family transcriptional regulator
MSPRPYRMARRRENADQTRARIIAATRQLIIDQERAGTFSMEAVARRAGVARMTVYYQFGSLRGLLEALLDSLAIAGGMNHLADAFRLADARAALDRYIAVFIGFWESDRPVLRRLGALATLDPELRTMLEQRYGWRRKGIAVILQRLAQQTSRPKPREMKEAADLLFLLTSFVTFDTLAADRRTPAQVTRLIQRTARRLLG